MSTCVFAYGTLEIPRVMETVTGRAFRDEAALLPGWARFLLVGRVYPGLVPASGARTPGRLYYGVDERSLALLDRFEGEDYERRRLEAHTLDGGPRMAQAWVLAPGRHRLASAEPWDRAAFERLHLARFLALCRAFHARERQAGRAGEG